MPLSPGDIRIELKENRKGLVLAKMRQHQARIRFHTETRMSNYFSGPLYDFLNFAKALLPSDKYQTFLTLFRWPMKTNEVTATIFDRLSRVFDGRNPVSNYQFYNRELLDDWEDYRLNVLDEPNVWRTKAWDFFRSDINSVLVVDLAPEQTSTLPEPYFYWLKTDKILTYEVDPRTGNMSWIIYRLDDKHIVVIDDGSYRVFSYDGVTISSDTPDIERPHDLGYCPARFFWDQALNTEEPDLKKSPISKELENLDWLLFFALEKRNLDLYAGYPIMWGYESECDYEDKVLHHHCDHGFLKDAQDNWVQDSAGLLKRCPVCGNKRLTGAGSMVEVPVPGDNQPNLGNPVGIVKIDENSLKYNVDEYERLKEEIINSCVGVDSQVITQQAVNEKQVTATYESQTTILVGIKSGFENAQRFVDETVCRLRYGSGFISARISLGTNFYAVNSTELRNAYSTAKASGASEVELDALRRQIIENDYRNNPLELQRMLTLSDLEPYRHLTREEVNGLYEKGLISYADLMLKYNFTDYVRKFEREQINVLEFGSALPYKEKIDRILTILKSYAGEQRPLSD